MTEATKAKVDNILNRAVQIMVALILGFQGWQTSTLLSLDKTVAVLQEKVSAMDLRVTKIDSLEERIRLIEGNRFTAKDGQALWMELAEIKGRLPATFPPSSTVKALERLEEKVDLIDAHLDGHIQNGKHK